LAAHEGAFWHFGGVPLECLYDNARTQVLRPEAGRVLWHPVFEDWTCPTHGRGKSVRSSGGPPATGLYVGLFI
jgi:hypothetical protein